MNFSTKRNKHRLFLTLQRRPGPGYHWALVLSPKNEDKDVDEKESRLFQATNSLVLSPDGPTPGFMSKPPWRYETKSVNTHLSSTIVARLLVAKFSDTRESIDDIKNRIHATLLTVPLVQNDPQWNCVSWTEDALASLRALGGDFATIPNITNGGRLERIIWAFGDEGLEKYVARGGVNANVEDLVNRDIRNMSDESA